jgi:hypothetical protein
MNSNLDRMGGLIAAYFLAATVAATSVVQIARAQETVPCPHPVGGRCGGPADHPILTHLRDLPFAGDYLHRVLVNDSEIVIHLTKLPQPGSLLQETCQGQTCCEEMLQQLGVSHDSEQACTAAPGGDHSHIRQVIVLNRIGLRPGQIIDTREVRNSERRLKTATLFHEAGESHDAPGSATFLRLGCPCGAAGECICASQAACTAQTTASAGCSAAGCAGCKCENCGCEDCQCAACPGKQASEEAKCGEEDCALASMFLRQAEHHDEVAEHHPLKLMQHIASLMAEKAAAEAALEAREEAHEQIAELFEAMAEVMADNAALDAKLQAQAEHSNLLEKMGELTAENARLKAHVELAAERAELAKSTLALTLENERLKFHLARLDDEHAAEAARTAARPHNERSAR